MRAERIDFPRILQEALRDVVRRVLVEVAEHGLPSFDHFYLSFRTDHPGVEISASLRQRYPEEMTIVLENQFWELTVDDQSFGVTLQFNTVPQRLIIPFAALTSFVDPPAEFGLRFDQEAAQEGSAEAGGGEAAAAPAPRPTPVPAPAKAEPAEAPAPSSGASVIRFDPSRRK